jgi:Rrf2 family transcriptional regulator, iron-sulfur cluster assembly transcription factor
MVITHRVRASISVLTRLAAQADRAPLNTALFSKSTGLSISYLEVLCAQLRKAGIIESMRGPGGGYVLKRPAAEIRILEVAQAVDPTAVQGQTPDDDKDALEVSSERLTPVDQLFARASDEMRNFLQGIRLSDLVPPPSTPEVLETDLRLESHHV